MARRLLQRIARFTATLHPGVSPGSAPCIAYAQRGQPPSARRWAVVALVVLALVVPTTASAVRSEIELFGDDPLVRIEKVEGASVLEGQHYAVGWVISSQSDLPVEINLLPPNVATPEGVVELCDIDSFSVNGATHYGLPDHIYGHTYVLYPDINIGGISTANRIVIQVAGNGAVLDSTDNISCDVTVAYEAATVGQIVNGVLSSVVEVFPLPNVDVPIGGFAIVDETTADASGGDENAVTATPEVDLADPLIITSLTSHFQLTASVTVSYQDAKDVTATDYARLAWTPDAGTNVKKIHSQAATKYLGPSITLGNGETKQICAHAALYDEDRWFQGPWMGNDLVDKDSICHSFRYVQEQGCESAEDAGNGNACTSLLENLHGACQDIIAGQGPNSANLQACLLGSVRAAPAPTGHNGYLVVPIARNHFFVVPPN